MLSLFNILERLFDFERAFSFVGARSARLRTPRASTAPLVYLDRKRVHRSRRLTLRSAPLRLPIEKPRRRGFGALFAHIAYISLLPSCAPLAPKFVPATISTREPRRLASVTRNYYKKYLLYNFRRRNVEKRLSHNPPSKITSLRRAHRLRTASGTKDKFFV